MWNYLFWLLPWKYHFVIWNILQADKTDFKQIDVDEFKAKFLMKWDNVMKSIYWNKRDYSKTFIFSFESINEEPLSMGKEHFLLC